MTPPPSALLALGVSALAAALVAGAPQGPGPDRPRADPGAPTAAATAASAPRARATGPGSPATANRRWHWPLTPRPGVVRLFRPPSSAWGPGHRGLDLAGTPGALVTAVADGVVTHAGVVAGRGTVTVTHRDGLRSTYEPVSADVVAGDLVAAGRPLGRLEATTFGHCGARACLHLGALGPGGYRDPLPLLVGGRVRLYPPTGRS